MGGARRLRLQRLLLNSLVCRNVTEEGERERRERERGGRERGMRIRGREDGSRELVVWPSSQFSIFAVGLFFTHTYMHTPTCTTVLGGLSEALWYLQESHACLDLVSCSNRRVFVCRGV